MEIATVVAGYEGRPQSRDALVLARRLAGAWDARVLATWVPEPDEPYSTATHEALRQRIGRARELRAAASEVLDGGPEWDLTTQPALWAADGLRDVAVEQQARAVAVGSTHLGAIGRVVLGSTAARLLRCAPCPIAVAPRGWCDAPEPQEPLTGVALHDGADPHGACELAGALSNALETRLVALEGSDPHRLTELSHGLNLLVVGGGLGAARTLLQTAACPLLVVPQRLGASPARPRTA